jgi:ABC-type Fe3+-siderophore transport system permease subunit
MSEKRVVVTYVLIGLLLSTLVSFVIYSLVNQNEAQAKINHLNALLAMSSSRETEMTASFFERATTNIDANDGLTLVEIGYFTIGYVEGGEREPLGSLASGCIFMENYLSAYRTGAPTDVHALGTNATQMFGVLVQKMRFVTHMTYSTLEFDVENHVNTDHVQLFYQNDLSNAIITGCNDIKNYSKQMGDLNPKFV